MIRLWLCRAGRAGAHEDICIDDTSSWFRIRADVVLRAPFRCRLLTGASPKPWYIMVIASLFVRPLAVAIGTLVGGSTGLLMAHSTHMFCVAREL